MLKEKSDFQYEIRFANAKDWKPAMDMVWKTFLKYDGKDYTMEGIRNFWDFITDKHLYQAFLDGFYRAWVATDGKKIIGFASLRDENLLSLLFVDEDYHRRGVGRALIQRLCTHLKERENVNSMKVKAAPYAVGFYEKNGFEVQGQEERYAGIRVTKMKKTF